MTFLRPSLALVSALILSGCTQNQAEKKAVPPVPVTTAQATAQDIPVLLNVVGRAEAYESVAIKSRVDGQVASVAFTEGMHVKQGEVLLQLDAGDFAARLKQSEAGIAKSEALLAKARSDTARYVSLKARNFVSEEKVNDIRTNEASAAATLRVDQAAAELARSQLGYTTIRAPFAGVVGARLVFPGSAVKTNDTVLATVNRVRPLLVTFTVPETHLPRIRAALSANKGKETTPMKVDIALPDDKSRRFVGQVRFVDNAVDPATGTIQMKAILPNEDEQLTPGQFLSVSLNLDTLKQAVAVPNEAVQQGADGNFLFVVKEDESVEVRKIETLASVGGLTAIGKGLQVGETIVTDGQLRLTAGAKVKAKTAGKPDTAAASPATAPAKN